MMNFFELARAVVDMDMDVIKIRMRALHMTTGLP